MITFSLFPYAFSPFSPPISSFFPSFFHFPLPFSLLFPLFPSFFQRFTVRHHLQSDARGVHWTPRTPLPVRPCSRESNFQWFFCPAQRFSNEISGLICWPSGRASLASGLAGVGEGGSALAVWASGLAGWPAYVADWPLDLAG